MTKLLADARGEFIRGGGEAPSHVPLPMPDGKMTTFRVVESSVMAPELAARFPEIRTYCGQGIDDPAATVRFDITPSGLHAQILGPNGVIYVEPHRHSNAHRHVSYYKRDYLKQTEDFRCMVADEPELLPAIKAADAAVSSDGLLRTYRLAVAATGEYTQLHGGTVEAGLAAIVTAINRVNGIYESELAIRFVLVANNDKLVFTNAATDPYSNTNFAALQTENQRTLDDVIGSANYDVGHVFCTARGGLAAVAVVCFDGVKAKGASGQPEPVGDPYYVDYVAHEIGHQFGAHHTFNGTAGGCGATRSASTAYEPGSGSTIMSYAGICGTDNLQPHSDPYFHSASYAEIMSYVQIGFGSDCAVSVNTGNTSPVAEAGPDFTIPKGTPFTLTATASDPDGDILTYCWEERDLGSAQTNGAPDNASSPLFRSFPPTTDLFRTFPRLADLLDNTVSVGERLPTLSRTMRFRVTVRDNRAGGGAVATDNMQVTVVSSAGPFLVTSPNSAVTWFSTNTVTWNVASTFVSPIAARTVDILLSIDGGMTFPFMLAADTPNDGAEMIALPQVSTSTARIKVRAHDNIFFNISRANFRIGPQLEIREVDGLVTVAWPKAADGWLLQQTSVLNAPPAATQWENISPATYQTNALSIFVTALISTGNEFYRLRRDE